MPSIGPSLPPSLQKRKHDEDEASTSDDSVSTQSSRTKSETKRRKVAGPAMPPAPLDTRPAELPGSQEEAGSASSSDDDAFGPSLPTGPTAGELVSDDEAPEIGQDQAQAQNHDKPQRDSWMLKPPSQNDLTARMDPSKLRARGFNSGKGARGGRTPGNEVDGIWTETPEEKAKRLKDEMMGVAQSKPQNDTKRVVSRKDDEETERRIREHTKKYRGGSLYDQHKTSSKAEDDDPSKRKFDYAKDVGGGVAMRGAQKEELLKKARDFGSKFSSGSYL